MSLLNVHDSFASLLPCFSLLTDSTFTHHNVTAILEAVEVDWMRLCTYLFVPSDKVLQINHLYLTPEESLKAVIDYYLTTSPYASWEVLASILYYREETRALEAMQEYLHRSAGLSTMLYIQLLEFPCYCI